MLDGGEGESGAAPQPPAVAERKETKEDRVREVSGRRSEEVNARFSVDVSS